MRRHQTILVAAVALLGLGLAAGCGSDGGEDPPKVASAGEDKPDAKPKNAAGGEAPEKDPEARQLQFTECLRDNGIDVEDPEGPGQGVRFKAERGKGNSDKMSKAMDACRKYAPAGLADGKVSEEAKKEMAAYIKCLRDQGVELGDPDPETGMPQDEDRDKLFSKNPTKEQEACKDKRPRQMVVKK